MNNAPMDRPIDVVIARLQTRGFEPQGAGPAKWRSRCPVHGGQSHNMMVSEGDDGTVLLHCHHADEHGRQTCNAQAIVESLALTMADLFPGNKTAKGTKATRKTERRGKPEPKARTHGRSRAYRSPEAAIAWFREQWGQPSFCHVYNDAEGIESFRVYRWDPQGADKEVRPVHPEPDGWHLGDPAEPLPLYRLDRLAAADVVYVVEGEKCAEIAEGLGLVSTTSAHGAQSAAKSDWAPLAGKTVVILPDHENGEGYAADVAARLHELEPRPTIRLLRLPGLKAKGDDIEQWLESLPDSWTPEEARGEIERLWREIPVWEPPRDKPTALANSFGNFGARIVAEIVRHEAGETVRYVEIEAVHHDGSRGKATVKAEEFAALNWIDPQLGMKFALNVGPRTKEFFQHAIRQVSFDNGVEYRHVFTSLGWQVMDGRDVYLHAGGAIPEPRATRIEVDSAPELSALRLPAPDQAKLPEAVRRVLRICDTIGTKAETISAIVMALPFRAVLGPTRTIPHFSGTTGSYKTSTACLALRFFAPGFEHDDSMPLSWSGTASGLERVRHMAKDVLLVIDNLIADGDQANKDLQKADTVFNSQGDLTARARMRADGSSAPRLDPRGCVISTGECDPRRRSAAGRAIIVQFHPGQIRLGDLILCHNDARDGWYAQAISCYAAHLAGEGRLAAQRAELRRLAQAEQPAIVARCPECHPRHAEAIAEWTAGFELFLRFVIEAKAIDRQSADLAVARVRAALIQGLASQAQIQEELDPAETFLEMTGTLLASQRVFLCGRDGLMPSCDVAAACGWRRVERALPGSGSVTDWETAPGATRIGWIDAEWIYLDPNSAHAAAERLARDLGRTMGSPHQVRNRLAETGRIQIEAGEEDDRRRFTPRVRVEKARRRALWLKHESLFEAEPEEPKHEAVY